MTPRRVLIIACASLSAMACVSPRADAAGAQLRLPAFETLQQHAVDSVNVTFGPEALGLAGWAMAQDDDPESADATAMLRGVKAITVRSFRFAQDNQYQQSELDSVRSQLTGPEWKSLVHVHQNGGKSENVDVCINMVQDRVAGLAIVTSSAREFTIVNIVGSFDPAKLARLGQQFHLPGLAM
jgi:hypothetical protein